MKRHPIMAALRHAHIYEEIDNELACSRLWDKWLNGEL